MTGHTLAARVAAHLTGQGRGGLATSAGEAAARAEQWAQRVGVSAAEARDAVWSVAVGKAVPVEERIPLAEAAGIVLTPADREAPDVVAARLAAYLAQRDFGVNDPAVQNAVRYAASLRYGATALDKVVFLAWQGAMPDAPPLDEAVFGILDGMSDEAQHVGKRPHPDIAAAWADAAQRLGRLPAAWLKIEASVKWDAQGLMAAVVQDVETRAVLTVAYMNRDALHLCLATGETHFWSRSRREIWHKGRTSGHTQQIAAMSLDCDRDAILVEVHPHGPACHTGATSCFFTPVPLGVSSSPEKTSTGA